MEKWQSQALLKAFTTIKGNVDMGTNTHEALKKAINTLELSVLLRHFASLETPKSEIDTHTIEEASKLKEVV